MKNGKQVGIMGGTFDPIHNGHLTLAQKAYEQFSLDKILFMPSGNSYMKKNVLDAQRRAHMVEIAIKDNPNFELSLIEVQRSGNTYTSDTLEILKTNNPDTHYYFIIGADSLFQIESWKYPKRIFDLATLICAVRDDYNMDAIKEKGKSLSESGAKIVFLDMPKIEISSSNIREWVRHNIPISEYVPLEIAKYIKEEHLYYEKD